MKKFLKYFGTGLLVCALSATGLSAIYCGIFLLTQLHSQEAWIAIMLFLFAVLLIAIGITFTSVIGLFTIHVFDECKDSEDTE